MTILHEFKVLYFFIFFGISAALAIADPHKSSSQISNHDLGLTLLTSSEKNILGSDSIFVDKSPLIMIEKVNKVCRTFNLKNKRLNGSVFVFGDESIDQKNKSEAFYAIVQEFKDPNGIVIDLGSKNGLTTVLFSAYFYHVIALDPNKKLLDDLERKLTELKRQNVSICNRKLSDINELEKPSNNRSNESHHFVQQITFKQFIFDYVYCHENLNDHIPTLIKCDIEEEENVIEDLFHFAYNNKCPIYISFHLSNWKSKKIKDFQYLFEYFDLDNVSNDICKYIADHPDHFFLFKPKKDAGILIKKNIPAIIIGYNQLTFIKNMVKQIEKYTSDIIIIDNNSSYLPLLEWYEKEYKYTLLRQPQNFGHKVYERDSIQKLAGDVYILTDPDLLFNPDLPDNFIQELIEVSDYFQSKKVGFALLIDSDEIREDVCFRQFTIKQWESQFWVNQLNYSLKPELKLFSADIDTTFCLINKKFQNFPIRIAGRYTCVHIPWLKGFQHLLGDGEYDSYLQNNVSTSWFKLKTNDN